MAIGGFAKMWKYPFKGIKIKRRYLVKKKKLKKNYCPNAEI